MGRKDSKKAMGILRWKLLLLIACLIPLTVCLVWAAKRLTQPEKTAGGKLPEPNPYTASDFGYRDGYLTCLAGESWLGIDVSHHQGTVDWSAVADSGVRFAMVRVGYRGYEDGLLHEDERARVNLHGAKEAGLKVGAYFFSQAVSEEEARQEADFAIEILKGTDPELPVIYDWEYVAQSARTGQMEPETLVSCVRVFCQTLREAGYRTGVYFNQDLVNTRLDLSRVAEYDFWLAMYSDQMTFPYRLRMWQYTDRGQVPGIEGDVDLNLYFP